MIARPFLASYRKTKLSSPATLLTALRDRTICISTAFRESMALIARATNQGGAAEAEVVSNSECASTAEIASLTSQLRQEKHWTSVLLDQRKLARRQVRPDTCIDQRTQTHPAVHALQSPS